MNQHEGNGKPSSFCVASTSITVPANATYQKQYFSVDFFIDLTFMSRLESEE